MRWLTAANRENGVNEIVKKNWSKKKSVHKNSNSNILCFHNFKFQIKKSKKLNETGSPMLTDPSSSSSRLNNPVHTSGH